MMKALRNDLRVKQFIIFKTCTSEYVDPKSCYHNIKSKQLQGDLTDIQAHPYKQASVTVLPPCCHLQANGHVYVACAQLRINIALRTQASLQRPLMHGGNAMFSLLAPKKRAQVFVQLVVFFTEFFILYKF